MALVPPRPSMALGDQPWTFVVADAPPPPPVCATVKQLWYINLDTPSLGPKLMTLHTAYGRCTGLRYDSGPLARSWVRHPPQPGQAEILDVRFNYEGDPNKPDHLSQVMHCGEGVYTGWDYRQRRIKMVGPTISQQGLL